MLFLLNSFFMLTMMIYGKHHLTQAANLCVGGAWNDCNQNQVTSGNKMMSQTFVVFREGIIM